MCIVAVYTFQNESQFLIVITFRNSHISSRGHCVSAAAISNSKTIVKIQISDNEFKPNLQLEIMSNCTFYGKV